MNNEYKIVLMSLFNQTIEGASKDLRYKSIKMLLKRPINLVPYEELMRTYESKNINLQAYGEAIYNLKTADATKK